MSEAVQWRGEDKTESRCVQTLSFKLYILVRVHTPVSHLAIPEGQPPDIATLNVLINLVHLGSGPGQKTG